MKINKLHLITLIASFFCINLTQLKAQLSVNTNNYTPQTLVTDVLLGQGVTASNITFTPANGSTIQLGFFNGLNSNLGLDSGIVLSTGNVMNLVPGNTGGAAPPGGSNNDLLTLANSVPPLIGQTFSVTSTNDAAILEFDFVPASDTVKFRYIFGSNEYTTYINTQYNDVFGFFISGPGITGNFSGNSENIAIVPNTNPPLPITISSVQPSLNGQYYISNTTQTTVALNGFTTVFTAMSPVICGETYHIRLAIADGSDGSLDSGVFLEALSFTSNAVTVESSTGAGDSTLVEGCSEGVFTFYRPGSSADTLFLPITVGGTATPGDDYNTLPDTIIFLPGQNTVNVIVNPINDGISEGAESISISFTQDICDSTVVTSTLWIVPYSPIVTSPYDTSLTCPNTPINISAQFSGGYGPYTVVWNTGDSTNTIMVNPNDTTIYTYTVYDNCWPQGVSQSVTVNVPPPSPITAAPTANIIACPGGTSTLEANASGGYPGYTYNWTLNGNVVSTGNTYTTPNNLNQDTIYVLTINDACGSAPFTIDVPVQVVPYTPISLNLEDTLTVPCPNTGIQLTPVYNYGVRPYTFTWSNGAVPIAGDSAAIAQPATSTAYYLTMTDACNQTPVSDSVFVKVATYDALRALASPDTTVCPGNPVTISVIADGGAGQYTYLWENLSTLTAFDGNTNVSISPTIDNSVTYKITVTDRCGTTAFDDVEIPLRNDCDVVVPNIITPNGDGANQYLVFENLELFPQPKLEVFNRWGLLVYSSDNYQNNWAPTELNPGVYFFVLELKTIPTKKGFFQLLK